LAASTRRRTQAGPAHTRLLWISALLAALLIAAPARATSYREDTSFNVGGTPQGIGVDLDDGELFVVDSVGGGVTVLNSQGAVQRVFGVGGLTAPQAIAVSPVAPFDVYVADTGGNRIVRFTNAGAFVSAIGVGQLNAPRAVAVSQAGEVFAGQAQSIARFTADGTSQGVIAGGLAQFQQLGGLAATDRVFATDTQLNAARSFDVAGTGGTTYEANRLNAPSSITVRGQGNLGTVYVADRGSGSVAVFSGGGPFVTRFGNFTDVKGIAFSPTSQRVYVVDGASISSWQEVPTPLLGKAMDIQVDTGIVRFKPKGSKKFKRLTKVTLVKNGTIIDARRGTVSITSLLPDGTLQSADFFKGIFKATTKRSGLTTANLVGGAFNRCPKAQSSKKQKPVRQLWADGKGKFKTQGRYLSAAIRGTAWQMIDTCSGSTVKVTEGSVTVRDFLLKKTVIVNAGGFYTVTAPHA
jgi:DNA-binding beta-propeller fold protein YncE